MCVCAYNVHVHTAAPVSAATVTGAAGPVASDPAPCSFVYTVVTEVQDPGFAVRCLQGGTGLLAGGLPDPVQLF